MKLKKSRQFTPEKKPHRNLTPPSTQISSIGLDDTYSDCRVKSYRTSQEKSISKERQCVKDAVLHKLVNYISLQEQVLISLNLKHSLRRRELAQQLERINQLSPTELSRILFDTSKLTTPKKTFHKTHQKTQSSGSPSYVDLYNKHRNKQRVQAEPTSIKKTPTKAHIIVQTEPAVIDVTGTLQYLSDISKEKEFMRYQLDIDERKQELIELDLQVLKVQLDIRTINNQTLQQSWEQHDTIQQLESQLNELKGTVEEKESKYNQLGIQLAKHQQEENQFQEQFNAIMQQINQLKGTKRELETISVTSVTQKYDVIRAENMSLTQQIQLQANQHQELLTQNLNKVDQNQLLHKLQDLQRDNKEIVQRKEPLQTKIDTFDKGAELNVVPLSKQLEQELKELDIQIDNARKANVEKEQEKQALKLIQENSVAQQQQEIVKQTTFIESMNEKLSTLLSRNNEQVQLVVNKLKDRDEQIQSTRLMIQELEKEIENIKNNEQNLTTSWQQELVHQKQELDRMTTDRQNNQKKIKQLLEECSQSKTKVSKLTENQTLIQQIDKYDAQIQVLQRQVDDRIAQIQVNRKEILDINEALARRTHDVSQEDFDQLKQLRFENSKLQNQCANMKVQLNQVTKERDQSELRVIDQSREVEGMMIRMDDCSSREPELLAKVKYLEKQLAEK